MNAAILALLALVGYIIAYYTYGKFLGKKLLGISSENSMPAHTLKDNIDFVPTRKNIVFGHHFTTIAGLGPIVGPAIGIIWDGFLLLYGYSWEVFSWERFMISLHW